MFHLNILMDICVSCFVLLFLEISWKTKGYKKPIYWKIWKAVQTTYGLFTETEKQLIYIFTGKLNKTH